MTKGGPTNPVGRAIYESMFLIFFPFSLFVLKVLYELLPLPAFLLVITIPVVYYLVSSKLKTRTDEFSSRYRRHLSEGLVAELEQEESDKQGRERKRSSSKDQRKKQQQGGKQKSRKGDNDESGLSSAGEGNKSRGVDADYDDEDLLDRMAQASIARKQGKKGR